MDRERLVNAVVEAIEANGGRATIVQTAKYVWKHHISSMNEDQDFFYTWQYEMRWAAQKLRNAGKLTLGRENGRNVWQLVK